MEINQTQEQLIDRHHRHGWKGIWDIVKKRSLYTKGPFIAAALISVVFSVIFVFHSDESFVGLKELIGLITSFFPALLGFSLVGYAMIVGFPNSDLIERNSQAHDYTLYQILSSFFAVSLILQIISTSLAYLISWLIKIKVTNILDISGFINYNVVNIVTMFILLFMALYSIFLTPFIVLNLFSLSQVNSAFLTMRKISKEKKDKNATH